MTVEPSIPLQRFRALVERRMAEGMSQTTLARVLDMPVTRLIKLSGGNRGDDFMDLTADVIQRVWDGLGVPPDYFFVEPKP